MIIEKKGTKINIANSSGVKRRNSAQIDGS
jgi:hypothetical protein